MNGHKLVLRFADGRLLKGTSQNFGGTRFHLHPREGEGNGQPVAVETGDLKAAFFVRDFEGNPGRSEISVVPPGRTYGRRAVVIFADGERLNGTVLEYDRNGLGFFLFPADPNSNNLRAFVVNRHVKDLRLGA